MTATTMSLYAKLCGRTLSRAHAHSGDRIAIAAYLGKGEVFDRAICDFAEAYVDQNERDHIGPQLGCPPGRRRRA